MQVYQIVTSCPDETIAFGRFLGEHLESGAVVCLNGELGSGKTCLTQGIARGLGVSEDDYVTSPSFALINEYLGGRLPLIHVDLYRIEDISELDDIGFDDIMPSDGVAVIEWADKFPEALPGQRLDLALSIVDDQRRQLNLMGHGPQARDLVARCFSADFGPKTR